MLRYEYDAWGRCKIVKQNGEEAEYNASDPSSWVAFHNHFRYRGYFYDSVNGLYYLQTRFYDPELCRFISPDSLDYVDPATIGGVNIYSYCNNNPVMNVDPSGHFALTIGALIAIGFGVGALIGFGASVLGQGFENGWENINWWQTLLDGVLGGISGALSMSGLGKLAMTVIGFGLGFVGGLGGALINGKDLNSWEPWIDIGISTVIGGIAGFAGGRGALNAKSLNSASRSSAFLKAAASYDKVLSKIAAGLYKNRAGAAGALSLTRTALVKAWNKMIVSQAAKGLAVSLIKSGVAVFSLNIGRGYLYKYLGW